MGAQPQNPQIPRWLRFVLVSDRAGSAAYIGAGFFFAPVLAVLSPWPAVTAVLWALIALAGLWLGLLGVAMATGLAMVLRAGGEIPDDFWRSLVGDRAHRTPSNRRLAQPVAAGTSNPAATAVAPLRPSRRTRAGDRRTGPASQTSMCRSP